jgi:hypothetical protein
MIGGRDMGQVLVEDARVAVVSARVQPPWAFPGKRGTPNPKPLRQEKSPAGVPAGYTISYSMLSQLLRNLAFVL